MQEKLSHVVRSLALDPRRLPERLDQAAEQLSELDPSEFDNDADRQEFEEILERLTREQPIGDESAVAANHPDRVASRFPNDITERIVNLASKYS